MPFGKTFIELAQSHCHRTIWAIVNGLEMRGTNFSFLIRYVHRQFSVVWADNTCAAQTRNIVVDTELKILFIQKTSSYSGTFHRQFHFTQKQTYTITVFYLAAVRHKVFRVAFYRWYTLMRGGCGLYLLLLLLPSNRHTHKHTIHFLQFFPLTFFAIDLIWSNE